MSEHVTVQWGVLYGSGNPAREEGSVEAGGVLPGGGVGHFSEADARYIASTAKSATLVCRTVRIVTETGTWRAVDSAGEPLIGAGWTTPDPATPTRAETPADRQETS